MRLTEDGLHRIAEVVEEPVPWSAVGTVADLPEHIIIRRVDGTTYAIGKRVCAQPAISDILKHADIMKRPADVADGCWNRAATMQRSSIVDRYLGPRDLPSLPSEFTAHDCCTPTLAHRIQRRAEPNELRKPSSWRR